ncbi:MAG: hypothetical protein K0Q55_2021 [Verrucomicrobia bacterium]|jgi:hypothetical protein|nr:hypothetical protein [Verrucomicrobiota bacterium]
MKPPEIFKIALRILGLVFLYHGLIQLPMTIVQIISAFANRNVPQALFTLIMLSWPLLLAWWLLRGAPLLVRLAYPETKTTSPDTLPTPNPTASKTDI